MFGFAVLASSMVTASGPVPPEISSFSPLQQDELVDHFTGDFRYTVPLIEVPGPNGGYPLALTYASGITPDQDASWVGLGWTLSPGAIVRQMRGVPDDFDPDQSDRITTILDIESNRTYGLGIAGNYEFFGLDSSVGTGLSFGLSGYFDNYRGFGISHTVGLSAQKKSEGTTASVGFSIGEDTLEGAHVGASSSLSLSDNARFGADLSFESSRGLTALSFSAQASYQQIPLLVSTGNILNYLGYGRPAALPGTGREMQGTNVKVSIKGGGEVYGNYIDGAMNGFYNVEAVQTPSKSTPAAGYLYLHKAIRSADLTNPGRATDPGIARDDDKTKGFALDFNREGDGPIYQQSPNLGMPVLTNDLFVVSGRDMMGAFRAYRNDTPVVSDPRQESQMTGGAIGVDVGFGNVVKVGVNGALNHSSTVIGRWDGGAVPVAGAPNTVQSLVGGLAKSFADDPTGDRERAYFKFIGEPSSAPSSERASPQAIAPKLTGQWLSGNSLQAAIANNSLVPPFSYAAGATDGAGRAVAVQAPDERVTRATLIQAFTNSELRLIANALPDVSGNVALVDANAATASVRSAHGNHIGAFRITGQNGTRYVYGLAVYNTGYEEHKFSVDRTRCPKPAAAGGPIPYCTIIQPPPATAEEAALGAAYDYKVAGSEQLLEIKKVSPYPTSYLLTAVVGPDYIDSDGIPGPSDGDVGYWVKFNYVLASADVGWRTPYLGASFVRGPDNGRFVVNTERLSDKGYFTYGKRDAWYLASVETATHKAFMCVDRIGRRDAIGAVAAGQNVTPVSGFERPWKLTSVRLYAKAALAGQTVDPSSGCPGGTPLLEAHLDYEDYNGAGVPAAARRSLAHGAPNAPVGKLTLKRVYFTHLDNTRGRLSPYEFNYGAGTPSGNPDYRDGERDRWNTYQEVPPAPAFAAGVPPANPPLDDRMAWTAQTPAADAAAAAWALRRITEPTGRAVQVDYEADDYAYVQDRPAMRFVPVLSVNAGFRSGVANPTSTICPAIVGQDRADVQALVGGLAVVKLLGASYIQPGSCLGPDGPPASPPPRVYFPLACDGAVCDTNIAHYVDVGSDSQILFKIRVALKRDENGLPAKWQTISGYANVKNAGIASNGTAGMPGIGWIELAPVHSNHPASLDYHPLAHAAWQYLRLQQPELARNGGINGDPSGDPLEEAFNVLTLTDAIPELVQTFLGVYPGWLGQGWGLTVDLDNSFIRLKVANGIKKGGGARVRRVEISDSWGASTAGQERDLVRGYAYSYRLENGHSSGVAAYEPTVGGDENPLRRAKSFVDQVLLSSNYNLFAELPIGESHYPGPAVGYSRVVRRSLAAENDIANRAMRTHPTSAGPNVYEFYTARDFPVRTSETAIDKQLLPFPQVINIPLLGTITVSSVTASQGYLTTINDMHGKPRRVANYQYTDRIGGADYVVREDPVKETIYSYKSTGGFATAPSALDNTGVSTLTADPDPNGRPPLTPSQVKAAAALARQSDFVVDVRQNRTESFDGGVNLNVDTFLIAYIPIPIPVPMPNFGYSLSETKTVVTSRVVHEAGIVDSVAVRQGSARIMTRNDQFDPLTGDALLSESDNAYGNPVYSYRMPARWTYPRMGPAYLDVGRVFDLSSGTFGVRQRTLTVPAAIVSACAEPPPAAAAPGPRCLPAGSELAAGSSGGGMLLTLLATDPAAALTTFAVAGDTAGGPPRRAIVTRSGNRNLLAATTDTIQALQNPLEGRFSVRCPVRLGASAEPPHPIAVETHIRSVLDATHVSFRDDYPPAGGSPGPAGNAFATGYRGIFRPSVSYLYRAERVRSDPVDLVHDGTYEAALFGRADGTGDRPATCTPVWLPRTTHTRYSSAGFEIETVDALNIPSAAQYGAAGTLPFAVAANAQYDEIGFEGFETNSIAHMGSASVAVGEGNIAFAEKTACVLSVGTAGCAGVRQVVSIAADHAHTGRRSLRVIGNEAFAQPLLRLRPGKSYLVSGWVSLGAAGSTAVDVPTYADASRTIGLQVSYQPSGASAPQVLATFAPDGPIIDGWQRIEGLFATPPGEILPGLSITFLNTTHRWASLLDRTNQAPAWFDDLRIQPADASLNAFVYDLATRRTTAKLDENNFATLYRYTPDGKVDLVRRETVRGIFAQQEGRSHLWERP